MAQDLARATALKRITWLLRKVAIVQTEVPIDACTSPLPLIIIDCRFGTSEQLLHPVVCTVPAQRAWFFALCRLLCRKDERIDGQGATHGCRDPSSLPLKIECWERRNLPGLAKGVSFLLPRR